MVAPMKTFSIVTPNFNMARFLPETIESVLANMQPGDQYFVVDGGSTDGSIDVIKRYESRLTGWVSEPDNGYADALAKGFRQCTGEFMCWINCGDLLLNGALNEARETLTQKGADLIFGDDVYIDENSRVICRSNGKVGSLEKMMLFGGWTPLQDACYWRRILYDRIGGIDSSLKYAADYDYFLRASWGGKCIYVQKVFSAFRRHADQKSISGVADYQREREYCRRRMLKIISVPLSRRIIAEGYYYFLTRWRHHVLTRFQSSDIKTGISAATLVVKSY